MCIYKMISKGDFSTVSPTFVVVEQAQVMSGVEMHHHEKQGKPGQLVDSYLATEAWAPTSSKRLLFFLSSLNPVQLQLLVLH